MSKIWNKAFEEEKKAENNKEKSKKKMPCVYVLVYLHDTESLVKKLCCGDVIIFPSSNFFSFITSQPQHKEKIYIK